MSHAERLHHRLLVALLLAPAGGACAPPSAPEVAATREAAPSRAVPPVSPVAPSGGTSGGDPASQPVAKTTIDPRHVEPEVPVPDARSLPTCPSGEWCGVVRPPYTGQDAVLGCPPTAGVRVKPIDPAKPDGPGGPSTQFDVERTKAKRGEGIGDACCYDWYEPCPGGRALRDGEVAVRAGFSRVEPGRAAVRSPHPAAAAAWLEDAGYEYTSVASFARAALELMAVGAPAELVRDCHLAALDELRHAEVCAAIAWSLGAPRVAPSVVPALAPREASWVRVAVDTFLEGCVGETLAALVAITAAVECPEPELRAALEGIAADEERHAALAWRTIRCAIERGGAPVIAALREAAAEAAPGPAAAAASEPADPALRRCGRLGARAQEQVRRRGWCDVVEPLLAGILARATPA